ncbi:MAG TPA: S8 family serine peptidase, partial [Vicinamibacteria bacterium]|nr:S8 family serine peptidase [Vicinamibacteria bacterium]
MRKVALAVVLLLAVSEMSGVTVQAIGTSQVERGAGARPGRARRKIRVNDVTLARRVQEKGGELLADYGSYQLLAVEPAAATALLREQGVEARDRDDQILLNARTIDTATDEAQALRAPTTALGGRRLHLVQFVGPVRPAWYAALEKAGARIVSYVPNNAYLVYGDDEALGRVRTLAGAARYVQWEGPFRDEYRLHPLAAPDPRRALSSATGETTALYAVQLVRDPEANDATLRVMGDAPGEIRHRFPVLDFENVIAALDAAGVHTLTARPDVVSIQPYAIPRKNDESQGQIVAGNLTGGSPTGPGYLSFLSSRGFTQSQFTASGFAVDVSDSGLDNATTSPNHFALYTNGDKAGGASRVVYNRLEGTAHAGSTIQGCDGHGTLNAHIVGGFADQTGFPHEDASGFNYGLGIAPFVKLGSSVIFDPSTYTFPNFRNLQSRAYRDGARISSNSWGAEVNGLYTVDSQAYDALVRDAQPSGSAVPVAGNQEMVVVFAAGNAGPGGTTTISPGTAKNVLTVGATEGVRAIGGSDGCGAT